MKRIIITSLLTMVTVFMTVDTAAQTNTAENDSIARIVKLNGLQTKRDKLEKEIKAADSKRHIGITGVSVETLEKMNNRQDSLCLALRSELVNVILEIKELSPEVVTPQFLQQYNNLINKKDETPAKPDDNPLPATVVNAANRFDN